MHGGEKLNAVKRHGFDPDTVFERILAGELPAAFLHRDELVSAFLDIQPINPGHALVIPNLRAATLGELPAATGARMFTVAQTIAAAIRRSDLACEGVNLVLADGAAAGQSVFHLHLHVLPRFAGDGFRWQLPERYYDPPAREDIAAVRDRIAAALNG